MVSGSVTASDEGLFDWICDECIGTSTAADCDG